MTNNTDDILRFFEFTQDNADNLRKMSPYLVENLPLVLDEFYSFIGGWNDLRTMFRGQEGMDYARNAQIKHWMKICEGRFDENYIQSVHRIGLTHHRLNLEPKWYIGGYAFITSRLLQNFIGQQRKTMFTGLSSGEMTAQIEALVKAVFLDMNYAISVYLEEGAAEKIRLTEQMSADIERDIGGIVRTLANETGGLEATAASLYEVSRNTSSSSAEVTNAAQAASANVSAVAAATEQISHSVEEVRNTVNRSFEMTQDAVRQADEVGRTVSSLVTAIENIADVSNMIEQIARQTNLLALNATIEAARAGDAGKGFAVVANEVKGLASQTAQSTEQIANEIAQIQSLADNARVAIDAVVRTIHTVSEYAVGMNSGMQEQAQATIEIAHNVDQAARGTADVTTNIETVADMSRKTEDVSADLLASAGNMAAHATELEKSLGEFLEKLRAA